MLPIKMLFPDLLNIVESILNMTFSNKSPKTTKGKEKNANLL